MAGVASLYTSASACYPVTSPEVRQSQQLSDRAITEQLQDQICGSVILAGPHRFSQSFIYNVSHWTAVECMLDDWLII